MKPVARDAVVDAFETMLILEGMRGATVDAVANRAGISKGGLLHHFPNKESLINALLAHLDDLISQDINRMAAAPEGAAAYFLKSSLWSDTPLDRALIATMRLADAAHDESRRRLKAIRHQWLEIISVDVGIAAARAVVFMGDGLYFNALWESRSPRADSTRQEDVERLLTTIQRLRIRSKTPGV